MISCTWLYNALQKEKQKIILVDCRDYEEYEQEHIATAVCMPPELGLNEDGEEDFVDLTELNESYFKHPKHFQHYETREKKFLVVYNDNDHNMWIGHVISCMDVEGVVTNVQALEEGLTEFKERYPFLITQNPDPQSIFDIPAYPFPTEVRRDLYLSVSPDIQTKHVENLGINVVLYVGAPPSCDDSLQNILVPIWKEFDTKGRIFTPEYAKTFLALMDEIKLKGEKVLLHSESHQEVISLAILSLVSEKVALREAYHLVIQSYWKDAVALDKCCVEWLSVEEKRLAGSTSLTDKEIESGVVEEVSASSYCSLM